MEKNRNFMYIPVLLVELLYLDYWIWPIWTIFVLLLCQFIKSNLSLSTPNPNKCQKYEFMTSRIFSKFETLTQFYLPQSRRTILLQISIYRFHRFKRSGCALLQGLLLLHWPRQIRAPKDLACRLIGTAGWFFVCLLKDLRCVQVSDPRGSCHHHLGRFPAAEGAHP